MNLFKRLSTSVTATLESAVSQVENHDAIVAATIKRTKQALAKTKARIHTLQQQSNAYGVQLREAEEQLALWTERAIKLADSDEEKALQCVARRNHCEAEIERLTQCSLQQEQLIDSVTQNMQKLQKTLDEMTRKHDLMRSRQRVADVNRAVESANPDDSLDDTFERWEAVVLEHEFAVSDACTGDALDHELSRQENTAELKAQLSQLTSQPKQNEVRDNA